MEPNNGLVYFPENPDDNSQSNQNQSNSNVESKTKSLIPKTTEDLLNLAKRVLESWKKHPEINLVWSSVEELEQKLKDLEDSYEARRNKMAKRSPVVNELKNLEKEINKNLNYVKQFIAYKFGKQNAKSYYADFGIIKGVKNYYLGDDRDQIEKSLKKLVDAVKHYNMDHEQYGKQYWQDVFDRYVELSRQNVGLVQESAGSSKNLTSLKNDIRKILAGVRDIIKAQNPQNYKKVLMEYGFIKVFN